MHQKRHPAGEVGRLIVVHGVSEKRQRVVHSEPEGATGVPLAPHPNGQVGAGLRDADFAGLETDHADGVRQLPERVREEWWTDQPVDESHRVGSLGGRRHRHVQNRLIPLPQRRQKAETDRVIQVEMGQEHVYRPGFRNQVTELGLPQPSQTRPGVEHHQQLRGLEGQARRHPCRLWHPSRRAQHHQFHAVRAHVSPFRVQPALPYADTIVQRSIRPWNGGTHRAHDMNGIAPQTEDARRSASAAAGTSPLSRGGAVLSRARLALAFKTICACILTGALLLSPRAPYVGLALAVLFIILTVLLDYWVYRAVDTLFRRLQARNRESGRAAERQCAARGPGGSDDRRSRQLLRPRSPGGGDRPFRPLPPSELQQPTHPPQRDRSGTQRGAPLSRDQDQGSRSLKTAALRRRRGTAGRTRGRIQPAGRGGLRRGRDQRGLLQLLRTLPRTVVVPRLRHR